MKCPVFFPILHYNPAYFTSCTMVDFDEKNSVIQNGILINMHVSIKADKLSFFFLSLMKLGMLLLVTFVYLHWNI